MEQMGRKGGDNMKRFILMLIIALSATVQVFAGEDLTLSANMISEKNTYTKEESIYIHVSNHVSQGTWGCHKKDHIRMCATLEYSINGSEYKTYNASPFNNDVIIGSEKYSNAAGEYYTEMDGLYHDFYFLINIKDFLGEENLSNVKNTINFRYTLHGYGHWKGTCLNGGDGKNQDLTINKTVTVYNLNPGEIAADTFSNPNVGRTDSPIYGIYGGNVSQNVYIGNKVSPSFVSSAENSLLQ
jgi:hypothetical protein